MPALTPLFGMLALLALVASGFALMVAPRAGRQLLLRTVAAIAIFVLGNLLLSAVLSALRR